MTKALQAAAGKDPDMLRAFLEIVGRARDARRGARAARGCSNGSIELGSGWRDEALARADPRGAPRDRRAAVKEDAMKVDSSGVGLDVQVEGEGRPVVLLHGFPDTKRLWSKQVPALVDAGLPGDHVRPARLRRERQARRGRGVLDPVPRDRRHRDPRPPRHRAGAPRRPRLGRGGGVGDRVARAAIASTISSRCRSGTRSRSRTWAWPSARSRGTCCCSSSRRRPSSG